MLIISGGEPSENCMFESAEIAQGTFEAVCEKKLADCVHKLCKFILKIFRASAKLIYLLA